MCFVSVAISIKIRVIKPCFQRRRRSPDATTDVMSNFCTVDQAAAALTHMKRNNKSSVEIDPKDPDHINCHMAVRRAGKIRVHAPGFLWL